MYIMLVYVPSIFDFVTLITFGEEYTL